MAKQETREKALAALLEAKSFTAAAAAAGISRRTLYSLLNTDQEFRNEYERQRAQQTIERAERMEAQRAAALDTVAAIMGDEKQPGAVRLKAADAILRECATANDEMRKLLNAMNTGADGIFVEVSPWTGFNVGGL